MNTHFYIGQTVMVRTLPDLPRGVIVRALYDGQSVKYYVRVTTGLPCDPVFVWVDSSNLSAG